MIRIGCSGWSYNDWRSIVYPTGLPQRRWLQHYQGLFDTVELNSTFYRLPKPETVETWAAEAPSEFLFAFKLGAFGSHRKKLLDPESWLPEHLDRARRLGDHLGPTLVQLPPRWKRNASRLDEFLGQMPSEMRCAVELRDPTWIHEDVFDVLHRRSAALCIHDLLPSHPFELTTGWTYIRFHGPDAINHPYHGAYGPLGLQPWIERLELVADEGHDIYAYFNNDWDGHAVNDATLLRRALAQDVPTGGT